MGTGDHLRRKSRPCSPPRLGHRHLGYVVPAGCPRDPMAHSRPQGDASVVRRTALGSIAMFIVLMMMLNVAVGRAADVEAKTTFAELLADLDRRAISSA